MRGVSIDYDAIRAKYSSVEYDPLVSKLRRSLPAHWQKAYRRMAGGPSNVLRFSDHGVDFLFDHVSELVDRGERSADPTAEDRIVVAFGRTNGSTGRVGQQESRGLLGRAAMLLGGGANRDHLPGGLLGTRLDVCLFPQRRDLGKEWTSDGRAYRAMERYCAEHPGTFVFTRPIYDSSSWWPQEIEHGLLRRDGTFWMLRFENTAPQPLLVSLRPSWRTQVTAP